MMALTRPNHWGVKALQVVSNVKGKITFKALTDINRQDVFEIDKEHSFESGSDIKKVRLWWLIFLKSMILPLEKCLTE